MVQEKRMFSLVQLQQYVRLFYTTSHLSMMPELHRTMSVPFPSAPSITAPSKKNKPEKVTLLAKSRQGGDAIRLER